jgi:hypothetical protein
MLYIRFKVDGVVYNQRTGLADTARNRKKAEQLEYVARQLVLDGKAHQLKIPAIPFSDAAEQFLNWADGENAGDKHGTYLRIKSSFTSVREFFGRKTVSGITDGQIEDFKSYRRKMGVKEVSLGSMAKFWRLPDWRLSPMIFGIRSRRGRPLTVCRCRCWRPRWATPTSAA